MSRGLVEPMIPEGRVWLSGFTPGLTPDDARDLADRLLNAADCVESLEAVTACPCGDPDCWYFASHYPYCWGCDQHHRAPVAAGPEARCPVDVIREVLDRDEAKGPLATHDS